MPTPVLLQMNEVVLPKMFFASVSTIRKNEPTVGLVHYKSWPLGKSVSQLQRLRPQLIGEDGYQWRGPRMTTHESCARITRQVLKFLAPVPFFC